MSRRPPAKIDVTLFPFLSVLCAMIGVMMLFLILVISSRVIEAEEEIGQSGGEPSQGKSLPDSLTEADRAALEAEWQALDKDRQQLESDRDELLRLRDELRDLEANRAEALQPVGEAKVGRRLGERERRIFVPDATRRTTRRPRFVEVSAEGLLVHPQKTLYPADALQAGGKSLAELLVPLAREDAQEYLILLVHPNGAETYLKLRDHLRDVYEDRVQVGVEPFAAEWLLVEP